MEEIMRQFIFLVMAGCFGFSVNTWAATAFEGVTISAKTFDGLARVILSEEKDVTAAAPVIGGRVRANLTTTTQTLGILRGKDPKQTYVVYRIDKDYRLKNKEQLIKRSLYSGKTAGAFFGAVAGFIGSCIYKGITAPTQPLTRRFLLIASGVPALGGQYFLGRLAEKKAKEHPETWRGTSYRVEPVVLSEDK
ncbi:MAG: hypothetical protein HY401_03795 [Elusimicrobia bacterium]|nr:hypothetical protein [Elusimicrobiota bacterium]